MKVTKEELLELYLKGAYKYEDICFVNCMDNKKLMKEHSLIIEKIKNGTVSKKDLREVAHIFDFANVDIEKLII